MGNRPGNTGGKKGHSGRRPKWFKEFAGDVLADPATLEAIKSRARNPDAHGFWEGVKMLAKAAGEIQDNGVAAHIETPEGVTFTLRLGERGDPDE